MPAPQYCPTPRELDDLELLLSGALAPLTAFGDPAEPGVTLSLPPELADAAEVDLVDPEGLPLARYAPASLTPLSHPAYGPFRRLHLTPAEVREQYAGALTVPVAAPLTVDDLELITQKAAGRDVVLLALNGTGTPQHVSPVGLVRATLAAATLLGGRAASEASGQLGGRAASEASGQLGGRAASEASGQSRPAHVVAVPLPSHGDPDLDHALGQQVTANYAGGEVLAVSGEGEWPEEIAAIIDQDQPTEDERGFVVFFTGLSGSGKSTLARALHDLILEDGRRTVTSLDGDVVRRNLSAGPDLLQGGP